MGITWTLLIFCLTCRVQVFAITDIPDPIMCYRTAEAIEFRAVKPVETRCLEERGA